jgi:branched-chain amino acid transport system substrate-binding protein
LAGCGTNAKVGDRIPGGTLTIYASLPLHGPARTNAQAVLSGAEVALSQIRSRVGRYRVVLTALDDSNPQSGDWDPGQTAQNAHIAASDRTTIGYLGDFNSGASAISIPVLNRLGIAQVSPGSTAVGLTSGAAGAAPGEPDKYYPTGVRTYAQIVPSDAVEAAVQVQLQRSVGCSKTYVLDDGGVDGRDTATSFVVAAQAAGLQVPAVQTFDPRASDYSPLVASVAQSGADCVLISAITPAAAVIITKQAGAALPRVRIFASAGIADGSYADPAEGGIPLTLDPRVAITLAALNPSDYPAAGRAFYTAFQRAHGSAPPYAIFGYEAMSLMLSAIEGATDRGENVARRSTVVKAIFSTRDRPSVLGTYSINRDGDTTLRRYGVYRVVDGQLVFWRALEG